MTTPSYYVTIDSAYRDNQKYPFPTDFAVTFKDTATGTNVLGDPLSANGFFTPLQIDPDYYSSDFRVKNGTILNLKRLPDNTFIVCGIIQPLLLGAQFSIYNDTTTFVTLSGLSTYNVYLACIRFTNGAYVFDWIIYTQSSSTNVSERCSFDIDENNNIYFLFDFISNFDLKLKTPTTTSTTYSVVNPTSTGNVCLFSTAFTMNGDSYYVNGHKWGYHIHSGNDDIIYTEPNGRSNVNLDNALNIYVSANTNPYDPTLNKYTIPAIAGLQQNIITSTYSFGGQTRMVGYIPVYVAAGYSGQVTTYNIASTGVTLRTTSSSAFGGAGTTNFLFMPTQSDTWFYVNGNNGYWAASVNDTLNSYTVTTLLRFCTIDLITGTVNLLLSSQTYANGGAYFANAVGIGYSSEYYVIANQFTAGNYQYRIYRVTVATGVWTLVTTSTNLGGSTVFSNVAFVAFAYIDSDTLFVSTIDVNGSLHLVKFSINPATFALTELSNTTYDVFGASVPGAVPYQFKMNSKYYLVVSSTSGTSYAILDVTNVASITKTLVLNAVTAPCQLYIQNSKYYIVDSKSVIYNIDDIANPTLVSSYFPEIPKSLSPAILEISGGALIGSLIESPDFELYAVDFVVKDVNINSTHYNQNTQLTFGGLLPCQIDIVNLPDYPYLVTLNTRYLYINDMSNIESLTAINNFNVIDATSDPSGLLNTLSLSFYTALKLTHVVIGSYIYFFLLFYVQPALTGTFYLLCVKTDLSFNFVNSRYATLGTAPGPAKTIQNTYVYNIHAYVQNSQPYCIVQYFGNAVLFPGYPRKLQIYQYVTATSTLTALGSIADVTAAGETVGVNTFFQNAGASYTYPDGSIWFFCLLGQNYYDATSGVFGQLIPINVTNPNSPSASYASALTTYRISAYSNSLSIIVYPDGTPRLFIKPMVGSNVTFAVDITNPTSLTIQQLPGWDSFGVANIAASVQPVEWGDYTSPQIMSQNPVTNEIFSFMTNIVNTPYSAVPPRTSNFTYRNYTNLNSVPGALQIPLVPANERAQNIQVGYYGQQVTAAVLMSTGVGAVGSASYTRLLLIDVTNPVYATTYYPIAGQQPTAVTVSYTGLQGVGLAFIDKMTNEGSSTWMSSMGSSPTGIIGINTNVSNVAVDSTLTYMYAIGGWRNKIENFNPNKTIVNRITSPYQNYNGFLSKITLSNNGTFSWILPSVGTDDTLFQRLNYVSTKSLIGFVLSYQSPVMTLYEVQTSGTLTNPISSQLNLANPSESASALVAVTPSGVVSFSCRLYSDVSITNVDLYDLVIDESTSTNRTIKIIGVTNTTQLSSTDSTSAETQITYTNIDPEQQRCLFVYTYDLTGVYKFSDRVEFPPNMALTVQDIKSFSLNNRVVMFPNIYTTVPSQNILVYNKDGTLGTGINNYINNAYNSIVIQYQYDPTYTDVNGVSYSKVVLLNSFGYSPDQLTNYYMFIQGSLFSSYTGTTTSIASLTGLNKNFSIRHNYAENSKDVVILNQVIDVKKLVRTNLSYTGGNYWAGNISKTMLPGVIAYNNTLMPTTTLSVTNLYGYTSLNTGTSTNYYLTFPKSGAISYVKVLDVSYNSGTQLYTLTIANASDLNIAAVPPPVYYGPYVYLTAVNKNVYYTLQFSPGTIYQQVYYSVSLNSLIIPNRRIKTSYLPGLRTINDFRYIYLELYNEDDNGNTDTGIVNNTFTNNPQFSSLNQRTKTLFQIPVTGVAVNSDANFIVLSQTSIVPNLVITPNYNNLHLRLVDGYERVIQFDETPNDSKSGDSIFAGSTVDNTLMQMSATFTFVKQNR